MYVCLCKGITKSQIEEKSKVYSNPKDILKSLGVGSDCGTCVQNALDSILSKKSGQPFKSNRKTLSNK